MSDNDSNHELDDELFALAAGSDNEEDSAAEDNADRVRELEAEVEELKQDLDETETTRRKLYMRWMSTLDRNTSLVKQRDDAIDDAKQAKEALQAKENELVGFKERAMALSHGNLDPFRRKPTLPRGNGNGPSGAPSTAAFYGPIIGFLHSKVGEQAAAESVLRAEKTFEMFRKLGVDHDEEKALALLDILEEQKKNSEVKQKSLVISPALAKVQPQDTIRKRPREEDAEEHRNPPKRHRKKMPVHIITCEHCRETGQSCDNGWPCAGCHRDGKRCYRIWCRYKAVGKCLDKQCIRVHDDDAVLGVVSSKVAAEMREENAVPAM